MPSISIIASIVLGTTGVAFAIFAGALQTFPCCGDPAQCGYVSAAALLRDFGCDVATNQKFRCCLKKTLGWTFIGVALFFLVGACFFGVKQCSNRKKKMEEKERRRQERERRRFLDEWRKNGGGSQQNIFYPQRSGSVEMAHAPYPHAAPPLPYPAPSAPPYVGPPRAMPIRPPAPILDRRHTKFTGIHEWDTDQIHVVEVNP